MSRFREAPLGDYPAFFAGVVVPMVTAYKEDDVNAIDVEGVKSFTRWLCKTKVSALFPNGGMGQWDRTTVEEKKTILKAVIEEAKGKKAVLAGVGSPNSLEETLEVARYAREVGADAIAVVTPSFLRPEKGALDAPVLLEYYGRIASEIDLPMLVYDARAEFSAETMRALVDAHPNVKATKYRTDDATDIVKMCAAVGDRMAVLSGIEYNTICVLAAGGVGVIGGGPNLFPDLLAEIIERYRRGDMQGARAAQRLVIEANDRSGSLHHPAGVKILLKELCGVRIAPNNRGMPEGLAPPSADMLKEVAGYFRALGVSPECGGRVRAE